MKNHCKSHRTKEEISRDFWDRVDMRGRDDCWNWAAALNGKRPIQRYGIMWAGGIKHKAHRFAYEDKIGSIPDGILVCHKCDNPSCCNPNHLFLGTHKDNSQDCISKGRFKKEQGSDRYNAKLTEKAVAELKSQAPFRKYGWGKAMAKKYGVGRTAINNAIMGRRWKQIGTPNPIEAITSPHFHKKDENGKPVNEYETSISP